MNLVMACTPVGREDTFHTELHHPLLAAMFFKRMYPDGKVYVLTTEDAVIPEFYKEYFGIIRTDFRARPFALCRQLAYSQFCHSELFDDDTIFAGSDVLFTGIIPELPEHKVVMSYRYHPAMPYCSDLVIVRHKHKEAAREYFKGVIETMAFMDKSIQAFWGDQLAIAIHVGKLYDHEYDGGMHRSHHHDEILLVSGDEYLYTPNDCFQSKKSGLVGLLNDVKNDADLIGLMDKKIAIHFKGNRKRMFFHFAYLAYKAGYIDPYVKGLEIPEEVLFRRH